MYELNPAREGRVEHIHRLFSTCHQPPTHHTTIAPSMTAVALLAAAAPAWRGPWSEPRASKCEDTELRPEGGSSAPTYLGVLHRYSMRVRIMSASFFRCLPVGASNELVGGGKEEGALLPVTKGVPPRLRVLELVVCQQLGQVSLLDRLYNAGTLHFSQP